MSNLTEGRTNQKLRTHLAIVEAAAQLVREGKTFTVAEAADRARVGRTTAYRYFPSVETLVAHASLYAITEVEKQSIGAALESTTEADERLRAVIEASDKSITDHEYLYRTMLKLSLNGETTEEGELPRRSGVRKEVLDAAIGALRKQLGEKHYERLIAALSLFLGIEAAVVLHDVCMLPADKARDVKVWGANLILEGALREAARKARSKGAEKSSRVPAGKKQSGASSEARR
jgi:AcrR family transcriptional regulator